ncbi:lamin tail domain-containing protein [Pedobacter mucosus]|uniref:lamin tail domain-containing protein n=1 Tax=Pedobacter mucosus TaxID=2895286 RepID=UPI001EE3B824|nr:lamin tail domain-containing protein [Pedobacter mucosus]UKT62567.1 lamin tail domain-containing protein [Pedobacter mucosus]
MLKITLISLLLSLKIAFKIVNLHFFIENETKIDMHFAQKKTHFKENLTGNLFKFSLRTVIKGDILISEVLFNPKTGGVDFVEIYNNSMHDIDLKDLQLANANTLGEPASIKNISATKLIIAPGSYWVITTNQANIKQHYVAKFPLQFIQLSSLPAYNNDKGSVLLLSNNVVIDRLDYVSKIHHPLIQDEDGISIERVSFTVETNAPGNFKSAAATVGFATPTYKNSQESSGSEDFFNLSPRTFSPDNDGVDDVLTMNYQVAENSSLATINIYSDKGLLVRKLLKNQTIGTAGNITWDGLNDGGQPAMVGIYVIISDIFSINGKTRRFKNTCVLAGKLN